MANVLKKLSAFVPTMEDTVGNLGPATAPAAIAENVMAPASAPIVKAEAGDAAAGADADLAVVSNDTGEHEGAKQQAAKPKPRSSAPRRDQGDGLVTLRTKDGGIDGRCLKRTGRITPLSLRLTPEMADAMKIAAYQEDITLSELTEQMWSEYLARRQSQGGRR